MPKRGSEAKPAARTDITGTDITRIGPAMGQGTAAGMGQEFFCATQGGPVTAVGPSGKAALPGSPVLQRWLRSACILQSQALQAAYAKKANRTARSQRWRAGEGKQTPRLRLLPGGSEHPGPSAPASCPRPSLQPTAPPTYTSTAPGGISQGREGTRGCTHLDGEQPLVIGKDAVGVDVPLEPGGEQTVGVWQRWGGCVAPSPDANTLCRERN